MMFEVLDRALVPLGRGPTPKGAKILAAARARVRLPGIEAKLSVLEFPNHTPTYFTS
jgi:hypothetical protein